MKLVWRVLVASHTTAVARGTVILAVGFLKGKYFVPPFSLEKPMNILEPNLVGETISVRSIQTNQIWCTSLAKWRFHMWWNVMVLWLPSPTLFSVFSASPQVAIVVRFTRLMAQKTCSDWYACLFRVCCRQIHNEGSPVQKPPNLDQ